MEWQKYKPEWSEVSQSNRNILSSGTTVQMVAHCPLLSLPVVKNLTCMDMSTPADMFTFCPLLYLLLAILQISGSISWQYSQFSGRWIWGICLHRFWTWTLDTVQGLWESWYPEQSLERGMQPRKSSWLPWTSPLVGVGWPEEEKVGFFQTHGSRQAPGCLGLKGGIRDVKNWLEIWASKWILSRSKHLVLHLTVTTNFLPPIFNLVIINTDNHLKTQFQDFHSLWSPQFSLYSTPLYSLNSNKSIDLVTFLLHSWILTFLPYLPVVYHLSL